jgi:hypothetical protein
MEPKSTNIISQCQSDLDAHGYCLLKVVLPKALQNHISNEDYLQIDTCFKQLTAADGIVFKTLQEFCPVKEIEFIISLRESKNEWEEEGIWHDDGSRILAFSLSLTKTSPEGGILEFRKKGQKDSKKLMTPDYGTMIVFKTGVDGFEHKINAVTKGSRLIIAGWCYP